MDDQVLIARIASEVRAQLVAEGAHGEEWDEDLAGQCVPASFRLRDALRESGLAARVYAGYFVLDDPDFETCACGSMTGEHLPICFFAPHVWVETVDTVIDLTNSQFTDQVNESLEAITVAPLDRPWRWVHDLPSEVPPYASWVTGEVPHHVPPMAGF